MRRKRGSWEEIEREEREREIGRKRGRKAAKSKVEATTTSI